MSSLTYSIIQVVDTVLSLYSFVLIIYAVLSWFNLSPYHPAVQFLRRLSEPVLEPVRRVIPPIGGVDLSVLFVLIGIQVVRQVLLYGAF